MKNRYVVCSPHHDNGTNKGRKFFSSGHEARKYANSIVGFVLLVDLKKNAQDSYYEGRRINAKS